MRAMSASRVIPPAGSGARGDDGGGECGCREGRAQDLSVLGHVPRVPCVHLPPNMAALSRKWARAAALAAMQAL
jgi:hypothetical protein